VIPAAALEFLRGLASNNEKPWFEAHRDTYESAVRTPATALVAAVGAELAQRGVPLAGDPRRSMFRIHRDIRFSKDKSPYKTNVGIVWYRPGGSKPGGGVLYFHLAPEGCFAAAGFHQPDPEPLDCIRERIRIAPDRFLALESDLTAAGLQLSRDNVASRMPKGYEDLKASPVEHALRLRSFMVHRDLTPKQVHGKHLASTIAALGADALPLLRFGWSAIDEVRAAG
jgi:uncharacterized protein (TIGR02453 family)